MILAEADDIEVVGKAGDGDEAVQLAAAHQPDVVRFPAQGRARPDLLAAVQVVASGEAVVAPTVTRRLIERFIGDAAAERPGLDVFAPLTQREREVLTLIARGLANAEIAQRLFLSEGTVKTHVSRVLAKLGLRDRIQAVILAYEAGLIRAGA